MKKSCFWYSSGKKNKLIVFSGVTRREDGSECLKPILSLQSLPTSLPEICPKCKFYMPSLWVSCI